MVQDPGEGTKAVGERGKEGWLQAPGALGAREELWNVRAGSGAAKGVLLWEEVGSSPDGGRMRVRETRRPWPGAVAPPGPGVGWGLSGLCCGLVCAPL